MKRISWTALKIYRHCTRLFEKYLQTHDVFLTTGAMEYGCLEHEKLQKNILTKQARTQAEKQILKLSDDWIAESEFEKTIQIDGQNITLHGFFDLYSPTLNAAIEYKTNHYDPLQLEFYSLVSDVYLLQKDTLILYSRMKQEPKEQLKQILLDYIHESKHSQINPLCNVCKYALDCPILQNGVEQKNIDALGSYIKNLEIRIERLKNDLKNKMETEQQDEMKGIMYMAKFSTKKLHKLKKEHTKEELIQLILDSKITQAITVDNKIAVEYFPDMFNIVEHKQLRIEPVTEG